MFPLLLLLAADFPAFQSQTIASDLRGGYQVVVADLNHDGKPDLIALASGMEELVWYENPTWTRHVLASGLKRIINCVVIGDDIVVAQGFENEASKSTGIVSVISKDGQVREIDRLPTSHRLRVIEINGKTVVLNAPLTGAAASGPDYKDTAPLVYYVPGEWKRITIPSSNFGVQHGIFVDGRSFLTASFSGIHRFELKHGKWTRTEIAKGDPAPCPKCGTSDIVVLHDRSIAAIEPWHGNQIVVYSQGKRKVIDDTLNDTHAIVAADLDGDGIDELIVAQRGAPGRVIVYHDGKRNIVDEGISAAACVAADLNADRRIDLACIGSSTHNLKIYWNLGKGAK